MKKGIGAILFIISIIFWVFYAIIQIQFKQDCSGYLKRAADANTIEIAQQELNKSILYLESNDITDGYTSVIYRTPDEDIAFFYQNLKACQKELNDVKGSTDQMATTNTLMKLRETLTDDGEKGISITYPDGLCFYPNNLLWGSGVFISLLMLFIGWIMIRLD